MFRRRVDEVGREMAHRAEERRLAMADALLRGGAGRRRRSAMDDPDARRLVLEEGRTPEAYARRLADPNGPEASRYRLVTNCTTRTERAAHRTNREA